MTEAAAQPFTCKVRYDDAGIYGCNVQVFDPRSSRWVPLYKTVRTQESVNTEPYYERCAWDDRAEARRAARRFIGKIAHSMGAA